MMVQNVKSLEDRGYGLHTSLHTQNSEHSILYILDFHQITANEENTLPKGSVMQLHVET